MRSALPTRSASRSTSRSTGSWKRSGTSWRSSTRCPSRSNRRRSNRADDVPVPDRRLRRLPAGANCYQRRARDAPRYLGRLNPPAHRDRPKAHRGGWRADLRSRLSRGPPGARARRDERQRSRPARRSEEHTSELQSHVNLVCRLLLEKKKKKKKFLIFVKKKKKKHQKKL